MSKPQSATKSTPQWQNFFTSFASPWPAIWLWIYCAILVLGLTAPGNDLLTFIKIGGIFLCLLYTLKTFPHDHSLQLAMAFTFIADVILAFNNVAVTGLAIFLLAQICHLFRLSQPARYKFIFIFISIATATIILDLFLRFVPLIYIVCSFYALTLITNIHLSWRWAKTTPAISKYRRYAIFAVLGFMLFLCCDSCTVLSYGALNAILPDWIYGPANFFAWLFYYPSQVLVSNSSKSTS